MSYYSNPFMMQFSGVNRPPRLDNTKLKSYLKLNNGVTDSSGNSNDGTVTGTTTFTTGKLGGATGAFSFNGTSYITLANESDFDFEITSTFSVSCWAKFTNSGTDEMIVTKSSNFSGSAGWSVSKRSDDKIYFWLRTSTPQNNNVASVTVLSTGTWYFITVTCAGSSNRNGLKIYINGILDNTGAAQTMTGSILNAVSATIGAESDAGLPMTGVTDDVQIWNYELTNNEIQALYYNGNGQELS